VSHLLLLLVLGADIGSPLPPIVEQRFQAIETDVARNKIEIAKLRLDVEALKRLCDKCDPPPMAKSGAKPATKIGCLCGDNCKCSKDGMDCGCLALASAVQTFPEESSQTQPTSVATTAPPEVRYVQRRVCDGRGQCHFETVAITSQPSMQAPVVYSSAMANEFSEGGVSGGCAGGNCGASGSRGGGPLKAIGRVLFGGKNK